MQDRMLNIAFIGNGKSVNRYHAPFVLSRPDKFRIAAIWEHTPGKSTWARIEGVRYTGDIEEVLSNPSIDLVVVNTFVMHYEYAKQALEHGKNVLVEKPFTDNLAQAEELFSLAKDKGLFLSAYQNRRFDSDFLTLQAVLASGKLGDVYEIDEAFDYWRPEFPRTFEPKDSTQSMIYWHAIHTVDQAVSVFGSPSNIIYDVRQILGEGHFNDYFDLDLFYEGGQGMAPGGLKYSVRTSYFRARQRLSFEAYGTRGYFVKERTDRQEEHLKLFYLPVGHPDFGLDRPDDFGTIIYYDEDGTYHEEKVPTVRGDYAYFYDNVYDVLVNGAKQAVTPEQTLEVERILETAVKGLR